MRKFATMTRAILLISILLLAMFTPVMSLAATWPQATGEKVMSKSGTEIDYSHTAEGYIMVRHQTDSKRLKLRLEHSGESYTYDLNNKGEWEVFSLNMGTGVYQVRCYRQVQGDQYTAISNQKVEAQHFDSEYADYLCPSQYVNYSKDSLATTLSQQICSGLTSNAEKENALLNWVKTNVHYDYIAALSMPQGYLPDPSTTLTSRMGVCFDYSCLVAAMLRVQDIPAKVVIGYADNAYHAWNEVLVNGQWKRLDITSQVTHTNVRKYTVERVY